jgi:PAS domain S-box-containing protein
MPSTPRPRALNEVLVRAAERLRAQTGALLVELWAWGVIPPSAADAPYAASAARERAAAAAAAGAGDPEAWACLARSGAADRLRRADVFMRRGGLMAFAPESAAPPTLRPAPAVAGECLRAGAPAAFTTEALYAGSAPRALRALRRLVGARHAAVLPVGPDHPAALWVIAAAEPGAVAAPRWAELTAAAAPYALVVRAADEAERARAAERRIAVHAAEEREFAGRVSRVLASHRDVQGAFHAVAAEIALLFPVDRAALLMYDAERDRIERVASDPDGESGLAAGEVFSPSGSVAVALRDRVPRLRALAGATQGVEGALARAGYRSALHYPLNFRDRTVGLLALSSRDDDVLTARHIDLLYTISLPLAVAVEDLRLRRAIQQSERKYRDLYDNAPDMLLSIGPDRRVLDCNATTARVLGYDRGELIGRPVTDFHDAEFNRVFRRAFDKFVREGFLDGLEGRYLRRDGAPIEVSMSATAIYDERGVYVGSRSVVRDITERKALERRVLEAAKLAAVGRLAAGVAHELNNPLAGVVGFAHLLLEEVEDEYVRDRMQKILESGERCRRIVEDLLLYARQKGPRIERVDLDRLMSRVVRLGEYQWRVANVTVTRPAAEGIPDVEADPEQMEQVFLSLMSNAVDAMQNGGELTIALDRSRLRMPPCAAVDIRFADTGPGIPPDVVPHIFEPFFTTKEVGKGTGLGLSIAYSIVRDHMGEILVETGRGRGTTFTVRLPVARPALAEGAAAAASASATGPAPAAAAAAGAAAAGATGGGGAGGAGEPATVRAGGRLS